MAVSLAQRTSGEHIATSVLMMLAASAVLAGTGFLIVAGGFQVLASVPLTWEILRFPPAVPTLGWTVTAAVAAAFMVFSRVSKHFLVTPLTILVGVLIFYLGLQWSGMSFDDARAQDLLFMPVDTAHAVLPSRETLAGV